MRGDPAAVPAGVYAKAYLEKLGVWKAVSARIVPSASVRAALAAVENGAADAAIVYRTDLTGAHGASLALAIPVADGPPIVYPAAITAASKIPDATNFLDFLKTSTARSIFSKHGFSVYTASG